MRFPLPNAAALAALILAAASANAATATGSSGHRHAASSAASHKASVPDSAAAPAGIGGRTLEDIHIEGEIPVPQVLFITAREQRRFMEFQHHRYLKSSRDVGASTVPPSRIVMSRAQTPPKGVSP